MIHTLGLTKIFSINLSKFTKPEDKLKGITSHSKSPFLVQKTVFKLIKSLDQQCIRTIVPTVLSYYLGTYLVLWSWYYLSTLMVPIHRYLSSSDLTLKCGKVLFNDVLVFNLSGELKLKTQNWSLKYTKHNITHFSGKTHSIDNVKAWKSQRIK